MATPKNLPNPVGSLSDFLAKRDQKAQRMEANRGRGANVSGARTTHDTGRSAAAKKAWETRHHRGGK